MEIPYKTNYLALQYREPGEYIPAHDPSFTNETFEKAVAEAKYDIAHHPGLEGPTPAIMAVYKLVAVVDVVGTVEV